jgi:DnaJ like chaperone protein
MDGIGIAALLVCFGAGYWAISKFWPTSPGAKKSPALEKYRPPAPGAAFAYRPPTPPLLRPWFEVLGVSELDSKDHIVTAYRSRLAAYAPDRLAGLGSELRELAEDKRAEIENAFATARQKLNITLDTE